MQAAYSFDSAIVVCLLYHKRAIAGCLQNKNVLEYFKQTEYKNKK